MIPVIGARPREVQIHQVMVSAVITCECGSARPLVIPGLDRKVTCQDCGETYVIQRIDYSVDLETADATLHQTVAKLAPAPVVARAAGSMFRQH